MRKKILIIFLLIPFIGTLNSQSLTDSLKAHYEFDGNMLDSSPNQNHLRDNSLFRYESFSTNDSAFILNGVMGTDQMNSFDNSSFNEICVALWFKATQMSTNAIQSIIQGAFLGTQIIIQPNTGNVGVIFSPPLSNALNSSGSYVDSAWHHVVSQNNGSMTSLYIDGILIGTKNETITNSASGKFHVGRTNLQSRYFTGAINDFRVYNRTLSQAEITALSQPSIPTSLSEIVDHSDFSVYPNPTNGEVIFDAKEKHLNVTLIIRNSVGQMVLSRKIQQLGKQVVSLENQSSGVYFVEVRNSNNDSVISKIIKY